MTRRHLLLALGAALAVALTLLAPALHWRLRGWLRGEAFYRGRPTSYWAREVDDWIYENTYHSGYMPPPRHRLPDVLGYAWTDRVEKAAGIPPRRGENAEQLRAGGSAAVPVLIGLLRHKDFHVVLWAVRALAAC